MPSAHRVRPESYRRGFILPLVITLIASLIILVVIAVWQLKPKPKNPVTTGQPQSQQATKSSTPDPTANWKTYYGANFSIKYPEKIFLNGEGKNTVEFLSMAPPSPPANRNPNGVIDYIPADSLHIGTTDTSNLKQAIKEYCGPICDNNKNYQQAIINNALGVKLTANDYYPDEYLLQKDEKSQLFLISLRFTWPMDKAENMQKYQMYKTMISTFKFTDETANNIDSKISYQVPRGWKKTFYNAAVELKSADYRYNSPEGNDRGEKILITTWPLPQGQTLKQVLDSWTGTAYKPIKIGNINGFSFSTTTEYDPQLIRYAVSEGNIIWDFSIHYVDSNTSDLSNQIFTDFIRSVRFK